MSTPPEGTRSVVVAIDGTSGSGKSSTARAAAARTGLRYLDTGAMFRAMTLWMLNNNIDLTNQGAVSACASYPKIEISTDPQNPSVKLDGVDVSAEIRGESVNAAVSPVSTVPRVRSVLLTQQRDLITASLPRGGMVVEGRDIGTVVWPTASVKLYLVADADTRAARRAAQTGGAHAAAHDNLTTRDDIDSSRATAPAQAAEDALQIDTGDYSLAEMIEGVVSMIQAAQAGFSDE
ncbi:MAG: (d)CMP kinase [Nocardioides sp.]